MIHGAGLACGLAFWGLIAASGMGVVLQRSVHVLSILKILGGLYLIWLAFLSARSACGLSPEDEVAATGANGFAQGLVLNLSNPKAVLAWMATLSVGLSPTAGVASIAVATGVCMAIGLLVYVFYSVVFSVDGVKGAYSRGRRWIDGLVSGVFAAAGIGLLRSTLTERS